jgi:hypothetical protein
MSKPTDFGESLLEIGLVELVLLNELEIAWLAGEIEALSLS